MFLRTCGRSAGPLPGPGRARFLHSRVGAPFRLDGRCHRAWRHRDGRRDPGVRRRCAGGGRGRRRARLSRAVAPGRDGRSAAAPASCAAAAHGAAARDRALHPPLLAWFDEASGDADRAAAPSCIDGVHRRGRRARGCGRTMASRLLGRRRAGARRHRVASRTRTRAGARGRRAGRRPRARLDRRPPRPGARRRCAGRRCS